MKEISKDRFDKLEEITKSDFAFMLLINHYLAKKIGILNTNKISNLNTVFCTSYDTDGG